MAGVASGAAHRGGAIVAIVLVIAVAQAATRTASFEKRDSTRAARSGAHPGRLQQGALPCFEEITPARFSDIALKWGL